MWCGVLPRGGRWPPAVRVAPARPPGPPRPAPAEDWPRQRGDRRRQQAGNQNHPRQGGRWGKSESKPQAKPPQRGPDGTTRAVVSHHRPGRGGRGGREREQQSRAEQRCVQQGCGRGVATAPAPARARAAPHRAHRRPLVRTTVVCACVRGGGTAPPPGAAARANRRRGRGGSRAAQPRAPRVPGGEDATWAAERDSRARATPRQSESKQRQGGRREAEGRGRNQPRRRERPPAGPPLLGVCGGTPRDGAVRGPGYSPMRPLCGRGSQPKHPHHPAPRGAVEALDRPAGGARVRVGAVFLRTEERMLQRGPMVSHPCGTTGRACRVPPAEARASTARWARCGWAALPRVGGCGVARGGRRVVAQNAPPPRPAPPPPAPPPRDDQPRRSLPPCVGWPPSPPSLPPRGKAEGERGRRHRAGGEGRQTGNLVDPASSHMLRSRTKPCISQRKRTWTVDL